MEFKQNARKPIVQRPCINTMEYVKPILPEVKWVFCYVEWRTRTAARVISLIYGRAHTVVGTILENKRTQQ
jgi:hypothetical protein